jgi:acetyl esterase/lipase
MLRTSVIQFKPCLAMAGPMLAIALAAIPPSAYSEVLTDIVYRKVGRQELRLDIYRPENTTGPSAVVLMFHSGGWISGDKTLQARFGNALATSGIITIGANYRLAPEFPYPKAVRDCQAALKWVRAHASEYDGDPHRIGLLGESAGAQLAALVGMLDAKSRSGSSSAKQTPVRAVANLLGPVDLVALWQQPISQQYLLAFFGGTPTEKAKTYRLASPINYLGPKLPTFLNIYATADTFVPLQQGESFHAALTAAGDESTLKYLVGADHGWPPDSPYAQQEQDAVLQFFTTVLAN